MILTHPTKRQAFLIGFVVLFLGMIANNLAWWFHAAWPIQYIGPTSAVIIVGVWFYSTRKTRR
jgi:cobalamin synthase